MSTKLMVGCLSFLTLEEAAVASEQVGSQVVYSGLSRRTEVQPECRMSFAIYHTIVSRLPGTQKVKEKSFPGKVI